MLGFWPNRETGNKYLQFHLDLSDLPTADWFVYLGVKFKFGLKLCVDYSLRCKMFLASVSGILRYKVMGYENVFSICVWYFAI